MNNPEFAQIVQIVGDIIEQQRWDALTTLHAQFTKGCLVPPDSILGVCALAAKEQATLPAKINSYMTGLLVRLRRRYPSLVAFEILDSPDHCGHVVAQFRTHTGRTIWPLYRFDRIGRIERLAPSFGIVIAEHWLPHGHIWLREPYEDPTILWEPNAVQWSKLEPRALAL